MIDFTCLEGKVKVYASWVHEKRCSHDAAAKLKARMKSHSRSTERGPSGTFPEVLVKARSEKLLYDYIEILADQWGSATVPAISTQSYTNQTKSRRVGTFEKEALPPGWLTARIAPLAPLRWAAPGGSSSLPWVSLNCDGPASPMGCSRHCWWPCPAFSQVKLKKSMVYNSLPARTWHLLSHLAFNGQGCPCAPLLFLAASEPCHAWACDNGNSEIPSREFIYPRVSWPIKVTQWHVLLRFLAFTSEENAFHVQTYIILRTSR